MICTRCNQERDAIALKPTSEGLVCDYCLLDVSDLSIDPKAVYSAAQRLCCQWCGSKTFDPKRPIDTLSMLCASQMMASICIHVLDEKRIDEFAKIFARVVALGRPENVLLLSILSSNFALPLDDDVIAASDLAVHAVNAARVEHRRAFVRLLAATEIVRDVLKPEPSELERAFVDASALSAQITEQLEASDDVADRSISKGGDA